MNTDTYKETIDTGLEVLAEAFIAAKDWSEKNNRSKVHFVDLEKKFFY